MRNGSQHKQLLGRRTGIALLLALIVSLPLVAQSGASATAPAIYDTRGLAVVAKPVVPEVALGKQVAVFIGINKYKYWPGLMAARPDAQAVRDILVKRYYVDNVYELYDEQATKKNIMQLFRTLRETVGDKDSVFIYYAGHGHLDQDTVSGYWLAHDAVTDSADMSG